VLKLLYSCAKVCDRVDGVRSQQCTMSVGLRQGCVLSPLLFVVHMYRIDKTASTTVSLLESRRINFFADDSAEEALLSTTLPVCLQCRSVQRHSPTCFGFWTYTAEKKKWRNRSKRKNGKVTFTNALKRIKFYSLELNRTAK